MTRIMLELFVTTWLGRTIVSICLIPLVTFVFTSIRFYQQSLRRDEAGQEPPTLPYAVPWIGSAFDLIWDTHRFLAHVK